MDQKDSNKSNVFSQRIRAGKRTYFFDVKKTKSTNDHYIIITESRRFGDEKYKKQKLFLYKEDFQKFINTLTDTIGYIERELHIEKQVEV